MVTMVAVAIKEPQRILEIVMKKIVDYFFCYVLAGAILVIFCIMLISIGVTEESVVSFVNNHRNAMCFIQAYIGYRLTEI